MYLHLATVVGFSVTASRSVQNNANQNGVPVCTSDIIYRLVDDIRERVTALLPVIVETKVTGEATILQLFDINLKQKQTMKIAGCRVTNGILEKQKFARVLRNGNIIFDGISASSIFSTTANLFFSKELCLLCVISKRTLQKLVKEQNADLASVNSVILRLAI